MRRLYLVATVAATALLPSAGALAQCRLCAPSATPAKAAAESRPLDIAVDTALDFSRAAQGRGGGSITIDERSGGRTVNGLVDLGGMALKGTVRLTGEPLRHVRISLPGSVRLVAPDGSAADVVDLRADVPPDPALDASGQMAFSFGGRLRVTGDASGEFRGRIPITADYQ